MPKGLTVRLDDDQAAELEAVAKAAGALVVAAAPSGARDQLHRTGDSIVELERKRRKLLDLHYAEQITADYFVEEERRISAQLEGVRDEAFDHVDQTRQASEVAKHLEQVPAVLETVDVDAIWHEATDQEKRVLVEEMVEEVAMYPDHIEVAVAGAPPLNVTRRGGSVGGCRPCVRAGGLEPPQACWAHWDLNLVRHVAPSDARWRNVPMTCENTSM